MLKKLMKIFNRYEKMCKKYTSTTLFEVLLVITLVMFLTGLSAAILPRFLLSYEVDSAVHITTHAFNSARTYAMASRHDSDWSVKISDSQAIVFKGDDFEQRDDSYDQVFSFPRGVNISGENKYVFSKVYGDFDFTQGASEIVFGDHSSQHKVNINEKGIYSY